MVYTITFNPAIDYVMRVDNYREGAVNRTESEHMLAGGKGINVSAVLKNLGVENTALGFTAGFTGGIIEKMTEEMGVKTDFIRLSDGFSRINVKIKAGKETEINGRGPAIGERELKRLMEKLSGLENGDVLVLAGSVPSALPDTVYGNIIERLSDKKLMTVVDATGKLLMNTLEHEPFLIKPNNFELAEIFGKETLTEEEIIICAKELQNRGARNVLVSMGKEGGILVDETGTVHKSAAPKGTLVNSTGAGDSTVAGFIAGFLESHDYRHAFLTGLSAGSASAFSETLATAEEVRRLYDTIK